MLELALTGEVQLAWVASIPKLIDWPAVKPLMFGVALMLPTLPGRRTTPLQGVAGARSVRIPLGRAKGSGWRSELSWPALPAVKSRLKVVGAVGLRLVVEKLNGLNDVPCTARNAAGAVSETSGAIRGIVSALTWAAEPDTMAMTKLNPSDDRVMTSLDLGFIG